MRVASQSTFTRYIFELPELTPVSSERAKDKLTLTFAAHLRFDLSDAKLSLPKTVEAIDADNDGGTVEREVLVRAAGRRPLVPRGCELRRRRHAGDAARPADRSPQPPRPSGPLAGVTAPDTVPAKDAGRRRTPRCQNAKPTRSRAAEAMPSRRRDPPAPA